jgi:hypothetical protein
VWRCSGKHVVLLTPLRGSRQDPMKRLEPSPRVAWSNVSQRKEIFLWMAWPADMDSTFLRDRALPAMFNRRLPRTGSLWVACTLYLVLCLVVYSASKFDLAQASNLFSMAFVSAQLISTGSMTRLTASIISDGCTLRCKGYDIPSRLPYTNDSCVPSLRSVAWSSRSLVID